MTDKLLITIIILLIVLSVCAAFTDISAFDIYENEAEKSAETDVRPSTPLPTPTTGRPRTVSTPRDISSPIFTVNGYEAYDEPYITETPDDTISYESSEPDDTEEETTEPVPTEITTPEVTATETVISEETVTETVTETDKPDEPETEAETLSETETTTEEVPESIYCWEISEVFRLINENRANAGVAPLTLNDTLCTCADVRAYEASITTTHTRPDGRKWLSVYADYGYKTSEYGECIAYGQSSPASCVRAWMNDYAHMVILTDPDYTEIGIGVYWLGGGYDWVADFG